MSMKRVAGRGIESSSSSVCSGSIRRETVPTTGTVVFIHAEHVVQSAWILFSLWMYVCMLVL